MANPQRTFSSRKYAAFAESGTKKRRGTFVRLHPQLADYGATWRKRHTMRKPETISFYRKRLPHWSVRDGLYFVTLRQKDSIPSDAAMKIRGKILELEKYAETEKVFLKRKIFVEMEKWLDRPSAEGILVKGESPQIIKDAVKFREENGVWRMLEYVVMPNHLHLFFEVKSGSLKGIISGFKRKTSAEIRKAVGFEGEHLWHREWFDHWSRSLVSRQR